MKSYSVNGNPGADICIVRLVGEHEQDTIETEIALLKKKTNHTNWCILLIPVHDWEHEMSPWETDKLGEILNNIIPEYEKAYPCAGRKYAIAGYSLAGLFSLWASYQTILFSGVVACSPSVWYPDWIDYASEHDTYAAKVYLSLGKKEHKTRNRLMASVLENINIQYDLLNKKNVETILEMNDGNHFYNVTERMVKGISWIMEANT